MARKAKKGKRFFPSKGAHGAKSWPFLPKQLQGFVSRQPGLRPSISYGGVTKSSRFAPRDCNPSSKLTLPQLYDTRDLNPNSQCDGNNELNNFIIPIYGEGGWWYQPCRFQIFRAFVLYNQTRPSYMSYDPWGTTRCYVLGHKPHGQEWTKQDCSLIDPNSSRQQYMRFTSAVAILGKFYALSLQGTIVVMEEIDSHLIITDVSSSRAVPSIFSKHFREYLVESNGEVLLIFLISTKSTDIVDNVEIFRLQLPKLSWKKLEGLGDRAVFAGGDCCLSVTASKIGCKGNCVFFILRKVDRWWVFDMESGDISPYSSSSELGEEE